MEQPKLAWREESAVPASIDQLLASRYRQLLHWGTVLTRGDNGKAEEIVQEVFIQAFKSLKKFKYAGSFEGWIKKIMVYCAVRHYRSKSKMHLVVSIESAHTEEMGYEDIIT